MHVCTTIGTKQTQQSSVESTSSEQAWLYTETCHYCVLQVSAIHTIYGTSYRNETLPWHLVSHFTSASPRLLPQCSVLTLSMADLPGWW